MRSCSFLFGIHRSLRVFPLGKHMRTGLRISKLTPLAGGLFLAAALALHAQPPSSPGAPAFPDAQPLQAIQQAPASQQSATPAENSGAVLQQIAPAIVPQLGTINGTVMDVQDEVIPGAAVVLEGRSREQEGNDRQRLWFFRIHRCQAGSRLSPLHQGQGICRLGIAGDRR